MKATLALAIFVKDPEKDPVKTRLAAHIGQQAACRVYHKLLAHTRSVANKLTGVEKYVFYGHQVNEHDGWSPGQYHKYGQMGKGLGERMQNTFEKLLTTGHQRVVLIGSDCPEISIGIIEEAFHALQHHDLVLGPAQDGGYYLVGMRQWLPCIFGLPSWSHDRVLDLTLAIANANQYSYALLPTLHDIDNLEDLQQFPGFLEE